MGRYSKLIMVTPDNNNKVYILEEDGDVVKIKRGRIDSYLKDEEPKPISDFDKILSSKIKKGYKDVTHLVAEKVTSTGLKVNYTDIPDSVVKQVIEKLLAYANKVIEDNYSVKSTSVTQVQVDEAQVILNDLSTMIKMNNHTADINQKLLDLYHVIPRRMNHIKNYLLQFEKITTDDELQKAQKFFSDEQDTLDSMAGQVMINTATADNTVVVENKTILDTLGIKIERVNDGETKMIKKMLNTLSNKLTHAFKVINMKTQKRFDEWVENSKNKKTELFWHGSRNQNFISILQTGMLIRPSGSIHTGSMFSDGIYMADKAEKSLGYSSLSGSFWSKGTDNTGYMAIFDVHVGNQKHIYKHDSSCYNITEKNLTEKGFDSAFAHGGADLRNNEFIVYRPERCTIKYLVELKH